MNKDDYIDQDGILEEILRQERDAHQRRRGNHEANADADFIRSSLKQHWLEQNYISRYVFRC